MKSLTIGLLGTLLVLSLSIADARAERVMTNPAVVVAGEAVTLGDLFQPAGNAADTVLFRAPQPGKRMILKTRDLRQIARAHGLKWAPQFGDETVIVERESIAMSSGDIAAYLAAALRDAGYGDDLEIELTGRVPTVYLATHERLSIGVEDLRIDERSKRFSALIVAPAGDPRAERLRVSGRMARSVLVPVPVRDISPDQTISERDLVMERRRDVKGGAIINPEQLVGMVAERVLRAGQPVRSRDIHAPLLVVKGRAVRMVYRSPGLVLTAIGTAVEDGSAGQAVRIINSQSKTVVQAVVSGPDTVIVQRSNVIGMN